MITSLDHIQIAMPIGKESQARQYYGELLGLKEMEKPAALRSRGGCWFELANLGLHLGVEKDFSPAKKAHPAFRISDLNKLAELFLKKGFKVTWDENLKGERRFYSEDIFGNRLEYMQDKSLAQDIL